MLDIVSQAEVYTQGLFCTIESSGNDYLPLMCATSKKKKKIRIPGHSDIETVVGHDSV